MLGTAEFFRGLHFVPQSLDLGSQIQGLLDQRSHVRYRGSDRNGRFRGNKGLTIGIPEDGGKSGKGGFVIVLRVQFEEFRAGHIYLGEAQVQIRFQLSLGQSLDLIHHEPPRFHRVLGHH
jgi:hypothetical protein